jgi:hypothetical protein
VDPDSQRFGGLGDFPGHLDVVARRLGIAHTAKTLISGDSAVIVTEQGAVFGSGSRCPFVILPVGHSASRQIILRYRGSYVGGPLCPLKRTFFRTCSMSAKCQMQTSGSVEPAPHHAVDGRGGGLISEPPCRSTRGPRDKAAPTSQRCAEVAENAALNLEHRINSSLPCAGRRRRR